MAKVKKKKKQSLPFGKASSRLLSLISGGFFRKSAPPSSGSSASVKAPVTVSPPVTVTPPVTVAPPVTVTPPSPTSKSELVSSKPDFSKTKVLATAQDFCVVEGSSSDTASPEESNLLNWRNLALLLPMFQGLLLSSKEEFKEFIFARFRGDIPSKGRIIGVVNAIWARSGPRIIVHKVGEGCFLLRVTNLRTREILLSRPAWMIAGSPMFVAPWSSDFSHDEPQLTTAVVPVEMRGVPYLLFNQKSLSRLSTAIGKPVSLAPETERKENFEVAKIWIKVSLLGELPSRIVTGFSNGKEIEIAISYPWLPTKCSQCDKFGHDVDHCPRSVALLRNADSKKGSSSQRSTPRPRSRESKSKRRFTRDKTPPPCNDTTLQSSGPSNEDAPASSRAVETGKLNELSSSQSPHEEITNPVTADQSAPDDVLLSETLIISDSAVEDVVPSPVFCLDRPTGYNASVIVFHDEKGSSAAQIQSDEDTSNNPFSLVLNRKCSRKATTN
ncbi:unnamed protein product [Brassica napus]|uniref:(rape) hypothetical protein n=1 Tax=Brassica napus TaxID=3708 RepID=A0A816Y0M4_BRANA|nr:unnamed protein product [Brassica napus]